MQTEDKRQKYSTQGFLMFYSISFNFIQYVCLLTVHPFSAPHKRPATATVHLWLSCGLAQCLIGKSHHNCTVPLLLFPMVSMLNAKIKTDIHWSTVKRSKYSFSQKSVSPHKKCWINHCLRKRKRLIIWAGSLRLCRHIENISPPCCYKAKKASNKRCVVKNHKHVKNSVHTHNLVFIAYLLRCW